MDAGITNNQFEGSVHTSYPIWVYVTLNGCRDS